MSAQKIMPAFVFIRRHDIELEAGFVLAGNLIVDLPREQEPTEDQQQMIAAIAEQLTRAAKAGEMATDAAIDGWQGGKIPRNAVDLFDPRNKALLTAWAKDRIAIILRVDPRNDGQMRLDSDMLRRLDLPDAEVLYGKGRDEPAS